LLGLLWVQRAAAHANLARAEPAPNALLAEAPREIRLWFTEPLEPAFSRITLRNSAGEVVTTPASQVDAVDAYQLFLPLETLPDGLYTVVWTNVSTADGHSTSGSFPFVIGSGAINAAATVSPPKEDLDLTSALVRGLNLFSSTLLVGAIAFVLLVWPGAGLRAQPTVELRLAAVSWVGWLSTGLAGALLLRLQASAAVQLPFAAPLDNAVLEQVVTATRFGQLWSVRMAAWVVIGPLLVVSLRYPRLRWVAFALGLVVLATTSLHSHASADQWAAISILADWFHLTMTAFWVGGLVQMAVVIGPLRRLGAEPTRTLGRLVGIFSNYARGAVAGLTVTGIYAAWLHIGSLDALSGTRYGQWLLLKLALFLPLLALAGVNLLVTQRRLQTGAAIWSGRLRALVTAEITLAVAVLAAVGALTSLNPARQVIAQRALAEQMAQATPPAQPLTLVQESEALHVHLTITPGWVGASQFIVQLFTLDAQPITDATLIRLRFEHQTEDLGRSELRIAEEPAMDGTYTIRGANLSTPGDWQIRATIQRPDHFDTVVDFTPTIPAPPSPPPAPTLDTTTPLPYRLPVVLWTGLLAVGLAGFFLGQGRFRRGESSALPTVGLLTIGVLFLGAGLYDWWLA
jgi:copper transport protein